MNKKEKIRNLKELLREAIGHMDYSMQRNGTPDEVWMRDIESLTAAIQALIAQDTAQQPSANRDCEMSGMAEELMRLIISHLAEPCEDKEGSAGFVARAMPHLCNVYASGGQMDAYGERIYAMECARAIKDIKDNYYAGYRVMGGAAALLLQKVAPWILEDESSGEEANP